ncbi:hypothetical protein SDJN02_07570, partial [Cucurbita argyrosperma subsp. argyrosperma]
MEIVKISKFCELKKSQGNEILGRFVCYHIAQNLESLGPHPVELIQSRLKNVVQHPKNGGSYDKQQKLAPAIT